MPSSSRQRGGHVRAASMLPFAVLFSNVLEHLQPGIA